jgi:hypothetical protein
MCFVLYEALHSDTLKAYYSSNTVEWASFQMSTSTTGAHRIHQLKIFIQIQPKDLLNFELNRYRTLYKYDFVYLSQRIMPTTIFL